MAKSKLQRLDKETLKKRVKQKRKLRFYRKIKTGINKTSFYLNALLFLYVYHLHGFLIPILTNIYEILVHKVAPIVVSLINKLPL